MPAAVRIELEAAIVTGAAGGLGRAYAAALVARGALVVVKDFGAAPMVTPAIAAR